jgi:hypothetical protein
MTLRLSADLDPARIDSGLATPKLQPWTVKLFNHGEPAMVRKLLIALTLGILLALPSQGPDGVSVVAPAQAQTRPAPKTPAWEAMWRNCRKAVFRKYGYRQPERPGKILLDADRASVLTDACMANGGRVN